MTNDFWNMYKSVEMTLTHGDGWGFVISEDDEGIIEIRCVETKDGSPVFISMPLEVVKQSAEALLQYHEVSKND